MNLAFLGCCALALKDQVGTIHDLPGETYERKLGAWEIALNGRELRVMLKFNGWPAGVIDINGGIIAAGGIANEDIFIEAIEQELGAPIETYMSSR
jgi:hypothetical protein